MKQFIQWTSFYAVLAAGLAGYGCRIDQNQRIGGEARATIVVQFPAAEACFTDVRLTSTEALLQCLEYTTGQRWTMDVSGNVVEAITEGLGGGAVDEPSNITATP